MNASIPAEVLELKPVIDANLFDGGNPANLGEMFGALAIAQGAFEPIVKNRNVTVRPKDQSKASYTFRYADLEEIRTKTTPHLATNGFALLSLVTTSAGVTNIRTMLAHKTGARIESNMELTRMGGEIKDFGATVTYMRRYVVSALLGVAADDDLEENGDQGGGDGPTLAAPIHPDLRDAKTIGELSKVMAGFKKEDKAKYASYYNQRQDEIEAATGNAGARGNAPAGDAL